MNILLSMSFLVPNLVPKVYGVYSNVAVCIVDHSYCIRHLFNFNASCWMLGVADVLNQLIAYYQPNIWRCCTWMPIFLHCLNILQINLFVCTVQENILYNHADVDNDTSYSQLFTSNLRFFLNTTAKKNKHTFFCKNIDDGVHELPTKLAYQLHE